MARRAPQAKNLGTSRPSFKKGRKRRPPLCTFLFESVTPLNQTHVAALHSHKQPARACRINAVLIRDYLPELCTDLVPALATLDVHELTHGAAAMGRVGTREMLKAAAAYC